MDGLIFTLTQRRVMRRIDRQITMKYLEKRRRTLNRWMYGLRELPDGQTRHDAEFVESLRAALASADNAIAAKHLAEIEAIDICERCDRPLDGHDSCPDCESEEEDGD
jgi:hypothetical protein